MNGNAPFLSAENGCGMSKFYTLSSKFCFSRKNARILRKVVVDTTDSLAEGISCRQPTAVPLRQKIPPAKREQTKMHNFSPKIPPGEREQKQKRAGSQRNQLPKSLPKTQNTTNEVNGYRPEYVKCNCNSMLRFSYYIGYEKFHNQIIERLSPSCII